MTTDHNAESDGISRLCNGDLPVYTCAFTLEVELPRIAKIFQSGNSQTVRLPKDSRFKVDEVEVSHEGGAMILRPKADANRPWVLLRAAVERGFNADFIVDGCGQPKEQERPDLVQAFQ